MSRVGYSRARTKDVYCFARYSADALSGGNSTSDVSELLAQGLGLKPWHDWPRMPCSSATPVAADEAQIEDDIQCLVISKVEACDQTLMRRTKQVDVLPRNAIGVV